jgi:hypothetical protein
MRPDALLAAVFFAIAAAPEAWAHDEASAVERLLCSRGVHGLDLAEVSTAGNGIVATAASYLDMPHRSRCWHNALIVIGERGPTDSWRLMRRRLETLPVRELLAAGVPKSVLVEASIVTPIAVARLLKRSPDDPELVAWLRSGADPSFWLAAKPPLVRDAALLMPTMTPDKAAKRLSLAFVRALAAAADHPRPAGALRSIALDSNVPTDVREYAAARLPGNGARANELEGSAR